MLNSIAIQGRLVHTPEAKVTKSGKDVCAFSIACDRQSGGQKETDFFNCTAFGNTALFVSKWFQKGSLILVDGRLQSSQYTDKNGSKRTAISVVASQVHFTGEKARQTSPALDDGGYSGGEPAAPAQNVPPAGDYTLIEDDGDLPF